MDVKHVTHFVEVDAVEDVGSLDAQDNPDAPVPVDEYRLAQSQLSIGKDRAPVVVARRSEGRGEVGIQPRQELMRDRIYLVLQAGCPDGEGKPAVDEYHRRNRYVGQRPGQEITLAGLERSGIDRISSQGLRHVKDRASPIQAELAGPEPVLEAGKINDVVNGLAPGVVDLELQSAAVAFGQRGGQPMVDRASGRPLGG